MCTLELISLFAVVVVVVVVDVHDQWMGGIKNYQVG